MAVFHSNTVVSLNNVLLSDISGASFHNVPTFPFAVFI